MSFPEPEPDPFDFDITERLSIKRVPVAYPILCSHVLTHTTCVLIAVAGRARAEEGKYSIDSVVNDCRNFVQIGLIARMAQAILARLRPAFNEDPFWEQKLCTIIEQNLMQKSVSMDTNEEEWRRFGLMLLQILLSSTQTETQTVPFSPDPSPNDAKRISSLISDAIESTKLAALAYLRDLSLVCQILIPNIFCFNSASQRDAQHEDSGNALKQFMALFCIENHHTMLESSRLQNLIKSWYANSANANANQLEFPQIFHGVTWPITPHMSRNGEGQPYKIPPTCMPLLGNCTFTKANDDNSTTRICYLPKSYTDLYAELSVMFPDSELTALCLVCGQVLNAAGKGECTKHSYKCGGGAGIFFLLQECVGLIMHGQKAAYIQSPYVDFYGETPQYRGRPLNLDVDRYRIIHSMWTGHLVRERVIAERSSTRQVIIPNFY